MEISESVRPKCVLKVSTGLMWPNSLPKITRYGVASLGDKVS